MNTTAFDPHFRESGFTLLEVLVAALVLAIGLLGSAALQLTGLRNNHSAYMRAQVTQLAYDIADRMRANPIGVKESLYDNQTAPTSPADCISGGCAPDGLAGFDLAQWTQAIAAQLPSGVGIVCRDSTPNDGTPASPACDATGSTYAVKIWWDDNRSGAANEFFVTSVQL